MVHIYKKDVQINDVYKYIHIYMYGVYIWYMFLANYCLICFYYLRFHAQASKQSCLTFTI